MLYFNKETTYEHLVERQRINYEKKAAKKKAKAFDLGDVKQEKQLTLPKSSSPNGLQAEPVTLV